MDKRVIYVFVILLIIFVGIIFLNLGDYNKTVGFNLVFSYEDRELLKQMSLRELLEYKSDVMMDLIPVDMIKIALPLKINIKSDEDFSVVITEEGKVHVFNLIENTDVIISGTEQELKNLFLIETNDQLMDKIEETNFEAVTFKGKLTMQIMEDYLGIKIVKNKSISQKVMSVITKPAVGIVKIFS